jgi:RHS repeat-associated protein
MEARLRRRVASNTSVTNITNNFTLAFWVNPQSAHEIDGEATSGYGGVSGQQYVWGPAWYDEFSGHSGAGVSVGTNGVSVYEHAGNYMPPLLVYQTSLKGWTHVAVVYENRQPKLYVNGTLVRTGLTSPKSFIHVTPANIGGMAYGYFNGQMDDVRVYNQVLSASEVLALSQTNPATNYTYDSAGNVTNDGVHTYQYDAENRLVSVDSGSTGQYAYDASNRRYKKMTSGATTHYIWQGSQVIAEYDGSTGASTADYVYSGSRMIAKAAGLTTQYFLSDRLSVRLMLNTSGTVIGRQAHLPFGEDFAESGTQEKHHFTSYERDGESGTDYAVNRQYSQSVARFNRPDLYHQSYNFKNPQTLNRYEYVENDPINLHDPLGLFCAGGTIYNPDTHDCEPADSGAVPEEGFGFDVDSGGEMLRTEDPHDELPPPTGGTADLTDSKNRIKRFGHCLEGALNASVAEAQNYMKDFDWGFTLRSMSELSIASILSGVVGVVRAAVLAADLVASFVTGAAEAALVGVTAILFVAEIKHIIDTGKLPPNILDHIEARINDCVQREGVYIFQPVPGKDYIPLLPLP